MSGSITHDTPIDDVRFVALDSETTGLNPRKDRLITIGAVAVRGRDILLHDVFDALLEVEYNSASVTVHGVTRDDSREGEAEPVALARLKAYLGDDVIVGHHIGHDIAMLNAGYSRHRGFELRNPTLDTMEFTLLLQRDGVLPCAHENGDFSLDSLCGMFDVVPHDRHTAWGDAFITAQVFVRLLKLARKHGRTTLGSVLEPFDSREDARAAGS